MGAGTNGLLNSSLEFGDGWQHADGTMPDSWAKFQSSAGILSFIPKFDYGSPQHGIISAQMSDALVFNNGWSAGMFQQPVTVLAGVGNYNVFSLYAQGYSGLLNFVMTISYYTAGNVFISASQATFVNAYLAFLGVNAGPVQISVAGIVPATTSYVSISFALINSTGAVTPAAGQAQLIIDRLQYEYGQYPTGYAPADGYQNGGGGGGPKDIPFVYRSGEYLLTSSFGQNGMKMNDHNGGSNDKYDLIVEKVDGLYPLPDIKVLGDYEDNAYHGGYAGVEHFASRTINMDLALLAASETLYNKKLSALKQLIMPDGIDHKLFFKRTGMSGLSKKFAYVRVRRLGGFDSTYESSLGFGKGAMQLLAADPALYDAISTKKSVAVGAGVTALTPFPGMNFATLPGSFRTYPKVTIYGPVTNPHITRAYGGQLPAEENYAGDFFLTVAIPAGQSVVVDFKDMSVTHSSGADWRQYIDDASTWFAMWLSPVTTLFLGAQANPNAAGFVVDVEWYTPWL